MEPIGRLKLELAWKIKYDSEVCLSVGNLCSELSVLCASGIFQRGLFDICQNNKFVFPNPVFGYTHTHTQREMSRL